MASSEMTLCPLKMVADFLKTREWVIEVVAESEISTEITDFFIPLQLSAMWRSEQQCLMVSCNIREEVPDKYRPAVEELLLDLNARIWMGHFEIAPEDECVGYRYTLCLAGAELPTADQVETMVDTALAECVRVYPALRYILVEGKKAKDAAMAAMLETAGEA